MKLTRVIILDILITPPKAKNVRVTVRVHSQATKRRVAGVIRPRGFVLRETPLHDRLMSLAVIDQPDKRLRPTLTAERPRLPLQGGEDLPGETPIEDPDVVALSKRFCKVMINYQEKPVNV